MVVPAVSRSRRREASGMIENLTACFDGLVDPRATRRCDHQLIDILVIAAIAVIACAESWEDIELYGRSKQAWLKTFLDLPNGIPSHDTFRRVFMLIDPDAFEAGFTACAGSLAAGFEREVVAIDGKSNEITAIPELLDRLALRNSIVTVDAIGCQTAIAERILARGADYLLTLKANRPLAYQAVAEHFEQHCFRRGAPGRADCDAFDDTHGRSPGPPPGVRQHPGCRAGGPERLARVAHRAGRRGHPQRQRHGQGRGRDPLLPVELPRRCGHARPGDPHALGHRERVALGARRHLPRGRQPRARPARRMRPGRLAQDRGRPRRPRSLSQGR